MSPTCCWLSGVRLSSLLLPLKDKESLQAKESNSSNIRFYSGESLPFRKIVIFFFSQRLWDRSFGAKGTLQSIFHPLSFKIFRKMHPLLSPIGLSIFFCRIVTFCVPISGIICRSVLQMLQITVPSGRFCVSVEAGWASYHE